jgi:hypothetical protein
MPLPSSVQPGTATLLSETELYSVPPTGEHGRLEAQNNAKQGDSTSQGQRETTEDPTSNKAHLSGT